MHIQSYPCAEGTRVARAMAKARLTHAYIPDACVCHIHTRGEIGTGLLVAALYTSYPLVMTDIAIENHKFSWENSP